MISMILWFLIGAGLAIFLLYIGYGLIEIISGIGECTFGDNGSYVIWLIIIVAGGFWLFL